MYNLNTLVCLMICLFICSFFLCVILPRLQRRLVEAGWQLCRVSNQQTQGARVRPTPPPPTADGYSPMTAYNTTAES